MNKINVFLGSIIICMIFLGSSNCVTNDNNDTHELGSLGTKDNGYVPDEATAIKIAEAIWLPIYGKKVLEERPFHGKLQNDSIWIVEGTLHSELGGTAYIALLKSDCKILKVTHGK